MAEVDMSFSRDIGAKILEVADGAVPTDAVDDGEIEAGAAAGDGMPRSICQTASDTSSSAAKVGGGQPDQAGR